MMKSKEKPIPRYKIKLLIVMTSLIMIERSLMISGIQAVPEQYLPSKLREYHSLIHRAHLTLGIVSLLLSLSSMTCFILFRAKTFADYSEAATFFGGTLIVLSFLGSFAWQSPRVAEALKDLKDTVQQRCQNRVLRAIYSEKIEMSNKFASIFCKLCFISIQLVVFPMALFSFYQYNASDSSVDSFLLPMPCVFPWNWQQPTGYLAAFCVECYWMQICALVVVCFLLFFSIFCVFFEAFVLDIKQSIADLSASVVFFDIRTASDRLRIKQRFSDIVQFHSHAKESIGRFSRLMALPLTVIFVLSSTLICTNLLNLESATKNPIDMFRMGSCFVLFLICIALFCFFGQRVTTRFEEITDAVYQCSWEQFPLKAQKLLPTMMIVCQNPVYIRGMNLHCTHEFFKNIINGTYSFFMVLRDFNH